MQGLVFICDEEINVRQSLHDLLVANDFGVRAFDDGEGLIHALSAERGETPDLVLLDTRLPGLDGLEVLGRVRALLPETPVVLMSAFATVRGTAEAMKRGASDFLVKPLMDDELLELVIKQVGQGREAAQERVSKARHRSDFNPEQIIGNAPIFVNVIDMARKVAAAEASVLIQGESGTGKELVASVLHHYSQRAGERFLTINCAALTDTLLESQLFGHLKGSFTGAVANQRGLIEEAEGGTLFLDEIGDISPGLQAKLLRVLQEREFMPLGATKVKYADVRFVAATNKDLDAMIAAGNFREDLYYRLNVVNLRTPALRERAADVPLLAEYFTRKFANHDKSIHPEALELLRAYPWPGNVRELQNVIEMATILSGEMAISVEHLPQKMAIQNNQAPQAENDGGAFTLPGEVLPLREIERRYIEQVFRAQKGRKAKTADLLGIARRTLDRKLAEYEITV